MAVQRARWLSAGVATVLSVLMGVGSAWADERVVEALKGKLDGLVPGLKVTEVTESPLPGVYQVLTAGPEVIYTTAEGRYLIVGEMLEVEGKGFVNVTETSRAGMRAAQLAAVPTKDLITYKPSGEVKRVLNVFTDIDCGYCRKLHQDIPALNALGIQVNYLAFPRSAPGTPSYRKAVSAWCAPDREAAMNDAKAGKDIPELDCKDNPVAYQHDLGAQMGVTGTPSMFAADGQAIRGYMPPEQLKVALGL